MSVERVRDTWERLGREDPLWAIMPFPAEKSAAWDLDEFMATGTRDVEHVARLVGEESASLGRRVLDFGCGVGRLSNALAERVPEVVGVDLAAPMVDLARRVNRHPDRLTFVHYDGRSLPLPDDSFDSAVSLVVLQHAPPDVQRGNLLEIVRVVRPGGVVVLQAVRDQRLAQPLPPDACRAGITILDAPESLRPSATATVRAQVTNKSMLPWPAGEQIRLGNHWYAGDVLAVCDDGRADLPHALPPGESAELMLPITAPEHPGTYLLVLDVVQELVAWWADLGNETPSREITVSADAPPQPSPPQAHVGARGVEMHATPISLLREVFEPGGGEILSATLDHFTDAVWDSYTYVIRMGAHVDRVRQQ